MKINTIIWIAQRFYQNQEIADLLVKHNICPLLDSSCAVAIWERLGKPDAIRHYSYAPNFEPKPVYLQPYMDECISVKDYSHDDIAEMIKYLPDLMIGETSTETIAELVDAGCKSITYTSYGWHLFRIFGLNIRMPFSTQLNTWKKLEKLYGSGNAISWGGLFTEVEQSSKFNFCWIMLDQVTDFGKLIKWCKDHSKTIGLVAPVRWNEKMSCEEMKAKLDAFIKAIKV